MASGVKHEATPNWRGACVSCGVAFERYVRPSRDAPQYCSQECRLKTFGLGPKSAEHLRKIGLIAPSQYSTIAIAVRTAYPR